MLLTAGCDKVSKVIVIFSEGVDESSLLHLCEGNAMNKNYLTRTEDFIRPFLDKNGYILLKTEFVEEEHNWYLRLYIDLTDEERSKRAEALEKERKAHEDDITGIEDSELVNSSIGGADGSIDREEEFEPGIDVNDCAKVSRQLNKWLDKEDFIEETYTLEVCSKGFLDNSGKDEI